MSTDPRDQTDPAAPGPSTAGRQPISYCPYCSEETLFPRADGGWECRSCLRAFQVSLLGFVQPGGTRP